MAKNNEIKKFWNFNPANSVDNTPAELIIYGEISTTSWWGDEVTPKQFDIDLKALGEVDEIVVRINSGGGDVFAANAIYTRLKDHKAHITVKIDGWAASAATIIAMAGDVIQIPSNGVFMIHDPKMGVFGYYSDEEFVKLSDELKVIKQSIINGYALKTGKDQKEISDLMTEEKWYTGEEAVESGFCDELMFEEVETEIENSSKIIVNSTTLDITRYRNLPVSLLNSRTTHNGGGFTNKLNKNQKKEGANTMAEIKTVDELTAAYPDLINNIVENAATAERNRIKNIETMALDGFDDIVNEAKFEKPVSAENVAMQIIAKQKEQGTTYLANRTADVTNSGVNNVGNNGQEGAKGNETENPFDAAIDKVLPATK